MMIKPLSLVVVLALTAGMAMVGTICFGSWLNGTGGCPAKMPWEMKIPK